jgi:alkylation response protein AidB-like acyl-CoA dehydrogenase
VRERVERLLAEHADDDETTFLGAQFDAGLARMDYPVGLGGLDAEPALQEIVDDALERAGRRYPWIRNAMGIGMCGPTIVARGTREQQERFLRPIFTAEEIWCQLFSEPGAGSDVAGLSTSAVRDGDQWIVNGSKIWTSQAHVSSYGLLLARTDPDAPKHRGLTAFIVDMHAPGVEVKPLRQITGEAEFNEVYLTDVRVPDAARLGPESAGWKVGMSTLMNERVMFGSESMTRGPIDLALDLYKQRRPSDPELRSRLIELWVKARVVGLSNVRAAANIAKGVPGPEGSIGKIGFAEINQDGYELCLDILGDESMLYDSYEMHEYTGQESRPATPEPRRAFLRARANSIEGGSSEIMRNILAERVLGLPPDIRVDKDKPWSQVPRS